MRQNLAKTDQKELIKTHSPFIFLVKGLLSFFMDKLLTRIAPTPSGFIHLGNACNFILTHALARHIGAAVWLRIDDIDPLRAKKEFINDIFDALSYLGLDWDYGAKNSGDFLKNYSFRQKNLLDKLNVLREKFPDFFYACKCSRKEIKGAYHGVCRDLNLKLESLKTSLRFKIEPRDSIFLNGKNINLFDALGDVALWTKDGFCSYQLASLLDDEEKQINLIVRGEDLFSSSAFQLFMAKKFGFCNFQKAIFIHHSLIHDSGGNKLSKSKNSSANWRKNKTIPFQCAAKILGVKEFWRINKMSELLSCKEEFDVFFKNKDQQSAYTAT